MTKCNRILIFILIFFTVSIFGQNTKIIYFKNSEVVAQKEDWDTKIIIKKDILKNKEVYSAQTFNKNNVMISNENTETSSDKKNIQNYSEKIFLEYNAKSINESNFKNGKITSSAKCVTMKGEIIFPDHECEVNPKPLDDKFQKWLAEKLNHVFRDEENPLKYFVKFEVTPDYKMVIKKINDKLITVDRSSLDSKEIKILEILKNTPSKYFEGILKKIAGKDTTTSYSVPVYWMGN